MKYSRALAIAKAVQHGEQIAVVSEPMPFIAQDVIVRQPKVYPSTYVLTRSEPPRSGGFEAIEWHYVSSAAERLLVLEKLAAGIRYTDIASMAGRTRLTIRNIRRAA